MTNLCELNEHQPGYWEAADRLYELAVEYGFYVNIVVLVDVNDVSDSERESFLHSWVERYGKHQATILSLTNEPYQNGFEDVLDDRLIDYAGWVRDFLGHRDFIIGDAKDGDDLDASKETTEQSIEVARHVNIIVLHNSRMGGCEVQPDGRLRRYIDHLEGFYDIMREVHKVNRGACGFHEESMGHASQRWVPLGNGKTYEREYDPDCAVAAALTSEFAELAYCYHYISEQDDGTPGLEDIGRILQHFPAGWQYRNDSWAGSCTRGMTWVGGKARSYCQTDGPNAGQLGYGTNNGDVTWANGYSPDEALYETSKCKVYKASAKHNFV